MTPQDSERLTLAVQRYCTCDPDAPGQFVCSVHLMLLDEHALRHLEFYRAIRVQLERSEQNRGVPRARRSA